MYAPLRRGRRLILASLIFALPACQPPPAAVAPLQTSLQTTATASPAVRDALAAGTITYGDFVDRRDDPFTVSYDAHARPTGRASRGVAGLFDGRMRKSLLDAGAKLERLAEPSRPRLDTEVVDARAVEDGARFAAKVALRVTVTKPGADAPAWSKTFAGQATTDRGPGRDFTTWWSPMNQAIELACAHAIDAMLVDADFAAALASTP